MEQANGDTARLGILTIGGPVRTLIGTILVLALTACSGSITQPINISNSPVTVDTCVCEPLGTVGTMLTVQPNGSATLTYETSPPQMHTMTLPSSLVSKLYSDLAAAIPLSSLPPATVEHAFAGSLIISVAGQTSPNILFDSGIAGTLEVDVGNIDNEFPALCYVTNGVTHCEDRRHFSIQVPERFPASSMARS